MESQRSKILANTFRMVQAFTSSLPLLLLNLYTLLSILKIDNPEADGNSDEAALDIGLLTKHLQEGINGNCPRDVVPA